MAQFISEFFYSAILWGSLGTAVTWWLWRRCSSVARAFLTLPLAWIALHTAFAWYGFVIPPSVRLVDAESGQPHTNRRVIATWISYPLALWTSYCSGRQAHLTDAEGDVSFRFAPWPTLVVGTLARGLNPEILGRIDNRTSATFPLPLFGETRVHHYAPHRGISGGPNTGCKKSIAVQYSGSENLAGEINQFEIMLNEACLTSNPLTLTDLYMQDLVRGAARHTSSGAPPLAIQRLFRTFGGHGCRTSGIPGGLSFALSSREEGGICAQAIPRGVRDQLCAYYVTLRAPEHAK